MYTAFERLPMGEAYEKLDKTKWSKYKHSEILSPFWNTESPFEEYKNSTLEIGFLEDLFTLMEDQCVYAPNNEVARSKAFIYVTILITSIYIMFNIYSHYLENSQLSLN